MKSLFVILISFCTYSLAAQSGFQVVDDSTGAGIPLVNIWIKNSNTGTTSDASGRFGIMIKEKDTLILSALGYQSLEIAADELDQTISLKESLTQLEDVIIEKPKGTEIKSYGAIKSRKSSLYISCGLKPWKIGMIIPKDSAYHNTPFLSKLKLVTSSDIKDAKFEIQLYAGNDSLKQFPLHDDRIYGHAKKGRKITEVDLDSLNIRFPDTGLMIVYEFLIIDENKHTYTYTDSDGKKRKDGISYEPKIAVRDRQFRNSSLSRYSGGKWLSLENNFNKGNDYELAIELVMTN
ncbi:carboxypeptidase-like regulatory domain-containing protein [Nonlabens ponticola]|uniref:Carboxypeptidase-like regulatory domain-containing protein n=1 Tax=Nonlabens ponticola TaxID=2496866 RepID=A0A3S9MXC2_9FLAO|nr:carboxypeptidase-like regulatory domain-containing protein [Nonlabens ponticola]AZQ43891.1 carboxypeptidase-like regulatory domain-containing protein [Nonlabens ponticola]